MYHYSKAPIGIDPYDADYGVASSALVDDPSSFDRINKILRRYEKTTNGVVDSERYNIVTRTYKEMESAPVPLKVATAFANTIRECTIRIHPYELIVGEMAADAKAAPVFPEQAMDWLLKEIRENTLDKCELRTHDYFKLPEDVKEDILSQADYWKGKTIEDKVHALLTEEELKGADDGKGVFMANAYIRSHAGHTSANYDLILANGLGKLKERIRKYKDALDITLPDSIDKKVFYESQLIAIEAFSDHIRRFAALAKEEAEAETDEVRRAELLKISENCEWISEGAPRDFYEAIQLYNFVITVAQVESNGHAICYGRFDQIFYPFYKKDLEEGRYTKEFMLELIENLYIKIFELNKLRDKESIGIFANGGIGGPGMTVGGVDKYGKDATNDLTYLCLEAHVQTRILTPWMAVRLHMGTPHELKMKVASIIRMGTGEPKIFNDEVTIPMLVSYGRSLEDARNYQVIGCVEPDVTGCEFGWHDAAYFNMAKVLELAINNGHCMECSSSCPRYARCAGAGSQLGLPTGSLEDFKSFDEVLEAYDKQMKYWCDRLVTFLNVVDKVHGEEKPLPFLSCFMEDCTAKGKDVTKGGARYNFVGPQGVGVGTVGDGLATIKQLVFDEKRVTGKELLDAAKANWEGFEPLYAYVNSKKVHHYGNDDDYADDLAKFGMDTYCKYIEKRPSYRGAIFNPGVYSVSINVGFGLIQYASIEGRKAWEPLSDCMGPVHNASGSHDIYGPTAMLRSVTKMDHSRAGNGTLLNWKFTPSSLTGDTGRNNLIALIDEYVARKGMHSQFTVVDASTLVNAQARPEEYKGLMVRVAGYSAYFVELSRELQDDIIGRTMLSFD